MHGLQAEYGDRIQFTYLDIDDPATEDLKRDLAFRARPQLVLLDGEGQVVKEWFGLVIREEFESAFIEVLN